jgi:hypothetical protein
VDFSIEPEIELLCGTGLLRERSFATYSKNRGYTQVYTRGLCLENSGGVKLDAHSNRRGKAPGSAMKAKVRQWKKKVCAGQKNSGTSVSWSVHLQARSRFYQHRKRTGPENITPTRAKTMISALSRPQRRNAPTCSFSAKPVRCVPREEHTSLRR